MSYLEDKYYEEHKYCPICGGEHYRMTLKGFIFNESHPEKFKDDNFIECIECGYKGIKHDCIANPEDCEHAKSMKDSSWEDIVTDEMIHEYASKQSHEWWQCMMDKWNSLSKEEQEKYNQFIGFNDFSDILMNELIQALKMVTHTRTLVYEEGNLAVNIKPKTYKVENSEGFQEMSHLINKEVIKIMKLNGDL